MKPGKLTALTDLSFPVSLTCISLKLQMLVHPHLHLEKKKETLQLSLASPTPKPCSVFLTSLVTLWSFQNRAPTQVSVI